MCFHNVAPSLQRAIDSVLNQTIPDWELIIIDDASSDSSPTIYSKYDRDPRFQIRRNAVRRGIGPNKALAGKLAQGEFIAILDGDDWLEPDALLNVLQAYRDDPRRAMVYSSHYRVDPIAGNRVKAAWVKSFPVYGTSAHRTDVASHLLTFRRREYLLAGGYDERFPCATDKQIISAMETVTYPHFIDAPLYNYVAPLQSERVALSWHDYVVATATHAESGLSIIIPYHRRPEHLQASLTAISRSGYRSPFEVVVISWRDDADLSMFPFARKIVINDGHTFNLGWLRNIGAAAAAFRKLLFIDCDIVVPPGMLDAAFLRVQYKRTWFPICQDQRPRAGCDAGGWRIHGFGICGVTKRDLFWSGGWPELEAWGGEDTFQHFKLRHDGCAIIRDRIPGLIHLDHPYRGYRSREEAEQQRITLSAAMEHYRESRPNVRSPK
jgi:glycosyltransferase involved in cell wall biosynthesis